MLPPRESLNRAPENRLLPENPRGRKDRPLESRGKRLAALLRPSLAQRLDGDGLRRHNTTPDGRALRRGHGRQARGKQGFDGARLESGQGEASLGGGEILWRGNG
jgi:hypothetical protein